MASRRDPSPGDAPPRRRQPKLSNAKPKKSAQAKRGSRSAKPASASSVAPELPAKDYHYNASPFFSRAPKHWSLSEYLRFKHPLEWKPRQVVDCWKKSLTSIATTDKDGSRRTRALELLDRYHEGGNGSDKHWASEWQTQMKEKEEEERTAKRARLANPSPSRDSPAPSGKVTFEGPFYGSFYNASVNNATHDFHVAAPSSDRDASPSLSSQSQLSDGHVSELPDYSKLKAQFRDDYRAMKDELKWTLASGRVVEKVLFDNCLLMTDDFGSSLARSFVIDLESKTMQSWFTTAEWVEITFEARELPDGDRILAKSLLRFSRVQTIPELRRILHSTSFLPDGENYDQSRHWDAEWADNTVRCFMKLWESSAVMASPHCEDWYSTWVWAHLIDSCLSGLQRGVTVERKEVSCQATAARRNRDRRVQDVVGGSRAQQGPKMDGIVRTTEDRPMEFCAMEVGKSFHGGETATKWLSDDYKLARVLRDMIWQLHQRVYRDPTITKMLEVVGIVCGGLHLSVLRMSNPRGYVCLLARERPRDVPTKVVDIKDLLVLISLMSRVKKAIHACISTVQKRNKGGTADELMHTLLHGDREKTETLLCAGDSP